ncbi:MAG: hypothetical protein CMO80_21160 [Verrucomicrobiales bacterium]|nr:hypothetical protein [Verrucomicrobiales bacterium]|tara:strand:- start:3291 stop:3503 length:213 start_codon:yes stop_codon:yes gene_type:complete
MCGIIGYIGRQQASYIVIEGLRRLEYRGYDSAGLAVTEEGERATEFGAGLRETRSAVLLNQPQPQPDQLL